MPRLLPAGLLLAGCRTGATTAPGRTTAVPQASLQPLAAPAGAWPVPDIVRRIEPSVAAVLSEAGEGSGVVWSEEGLVVTNNHVIQGAETFTLAFADGKRSPAAVVATDPRTELAILRSERRGLPKATFAPSLPDVGALAVAVGNPLGFEGSATAGIISGRHRAIPGAGAPSLVDLLQTDAAISPGNSGGALVDSSGSVVGINAAYLPPSSGAVSLGFAIPSPTVIDVVQQLLEEGSVRHPFFGIQPAPVTPELARQLRVDADSGVVVLDVVPATPAERAGIRPGDVIVSLDGKPVDSVEAFLGALRGHRPGDRVTVEVLRDGSREESLQVTLAELPPD